MNRPIALGITGFSLIAVTYGMARFSWGLMLPDIRQAIHFSPQIAGGIAACSYAAYCLSVFFASSLTNRFGPRVPALLAAVTAASGLFILAFSAQPLTLATGLFIAGLSSGLASPALAGAVDDTIAPDRQTLVNTVINAGTSAGIILSVPVLFFMPGGWRAACIVFALLALLCLLAAWRYLPGRTTRKREQLPSWRGLLRKPGMYRLLMITFVSGVASAAWWSFGPELLTSHTGLDSPVTRVLWLVSGGAGIVAVFTGSGDERGGIRYFVRRTAGAGRDYRPSVTGCGGQYGFSDAGSRTGCRRRGVWSVTGNGRRSRSAGHFFRTVLGAACRHA